MAAETREVILRTLRSEGACTVKALAEAAEVSPVSVRHHLSNLLSSGVVQVKEVRHGVGRPRHVYSLTDEGFELFPTRYYRLTNRLIDEIKGALPADQTERLFADVATSMASTYAEKVEGLALEERLNRLVSLLSEEGFEAKAEVEDGQIVIREMSCPYYRIGREHPEVCMIDQSFIAEVLGVPVRRINWIFDGDQHCTFTAEINTLEKDREE